MLLPTTVNGTPEIPDEVYSIMYKKWREEFEAGEGYTKAAFNQGSTKKK